MKKFITIILGPILIVSLMAGCSSTKTELSLSQSEVAGGGVQDGFKAGDDVMVEWKGSWWPAKVIDAKNNKWKVNYDGYSSLWDEWVGPERIKVH